MKPFPEDIARARSMTNKFKKRVREYAKKNNMTYQAAFNLMRLESEKASVKNAIRDMQAPDLGDEVEPPLL